MWSPQRLLVYLLGLIALLSCTAIAFPTNGGIPTPEELHEYLAKRVQDEGVLVGRNSTMEERGIMSCLASLCCFGTQDVEGGQQMGWMCPTEWPTLDDLKAKIQDYGNVGRQISFFYTGLQGAGAINLAIAWAACHTDYVPEDPGFVTWRTIVDNDWFLNQVAALMDIYGYNNVDPFMKLLSQAFAEVTVGDVYLFTPADIDPNNPFPGAQTTVAWVGWEYPALTRNPNVGTIYRVDPRDSQNDRSVHWTSAQGPSPDAPLGLYNAGQPQ